MDSSERPTVYWRPGCMFCSMLRSGLTRRDIDADWVNIWEEPEGAEIVRSLANGSETVPTVVLADQYFVNPSAEDVAHALGVDVSTRRRWFR